VNARGVFFSGFPGRVAAERGFFSLFARKVRSPTFPRISIFFCVSAHHANVFSRDFLTDTCLSLSLSVSIFRRNKQIGKTKITLPPPKEIAKYVCFIFALWGFVAGLFGALLSISVQMRRYKYRSLPQKFIGSFRYGDSADVTYPTSARGLYPWVAKSCGLTTTSNTGSYVNNDVTLWPECFASSAAAENPLGFDVDATCGSPCRNPY